MVGIDTGGTFTDAVVCEPEGKIWTTKVPTTPHDLTVCFADAIRSCAETLDLDLRQFLGATDVVRFSSTIATNTVLTRTGAKLGLLVTSGHEKSLYGSAQSGAIWEFLSQELVGCITESVSSNGTVEAPPAADEVQRVVRTVLERGARMLVVSLQNSSGNPANEQTIKAMIDDSYPRHYLGAVPVLLSTEISQADDDATRTAAAVANGYLHKRLCNVLYKLEDDLRFGGFGRPLLIVTTDGSVARVAKTMALATYQSGPTAGIHAGAVLSKEAEVAVAITADVGGTSTDFGLVVGGSPIRRGTIDVGGISVAQPSVELMSIALGGGSVCRVANGSITVGPESTGGAPGPACLGMGGLEATPTDAWLSLGLLDPSFYLGGRRRLDIGLARAALHDRVAQPLGLSIDAAALAVKSAVEAAAASGLAQMIERARSAAYFTSQGVGSVALLAYGGGGGILLPSVGAQAGIGRVMLPHLTAMFSAFGVSTFDVRHRYERRILGNEARSCFRALLDAARRDIRGEGFSADDLDLVIKVVDAEGTVLRETRLPGATAEEAAGLQEWPQGNGLTLSLAATVTVPKPRLPVVESASSDDASTALKGERQVHYEGGQAATPVFDWHRLRSGHTIHGPALVESVWATYFVPPLYRSRVDHYGTSVVEREGGHVENN
jgi:N-methylhydantoinase A/acetophenone carboxylase